MAEFNLDNIRMNVTKTASSGVVNDKTVFTFRQSKNMVWADYNGGSVIKGSLIGKLQNASLIFRYCQYDACGNLDGGVSTCHIERLEDGRLRMIERFNWESREETGENIFEELI